jgi:Ca-activated chloride channel family protein
MKNLRYLFILILLLIPARAFPAAGVLIPRSIKSTPDSSILSMEKVEIYININNQYTDVKMVQVYKNHRNSIIEGQYIFTMPDEAKISDFAIWEDLVRIPGVIMEKVKAREIYEDITRRRKDPGLLEATDRKSVINKFSCRVAPIPPYGTKRIEINYKYNLSIDDLKSIFHLALKPDLYGEQSVKELYMRFKVSCGYPIKNFTIRSKKLTPDLNISENEVTGEIALNNYSLNEDFVFSYETDFNRVFYDILTHRDINKIYTDISPANGKNYQDDSGYFLIKTIFNLGREEIKRDDAAIKRKKNVVFIFDASLSMLFDKLDRGYETFNFLINKLDESDKFNVLIFNDKVSAFKSGLVEADRPNIQDAVDFFNSSYISGGTDISLPFKEAFNTFTDSEDNYIIFISDGYPTLGTITLKTVKDEIRKSNVRNVKIFPFGIGDDTNKYFMEDLARENDGYFNYISNTQTLMIKQEIFFSKIGQTMVKGFSFLYDSDNLYDVYPVESVNLFNKTSIDYIGKYKAAGKESFSLKGDYGGTELLYKFEGDLPDINRENEHLRRVWAEKRVEYLLKKIRFEGEKDEYIKEIISLAKQFKFVTPYTSFLAAPRALLRPRVIKPGDPVLKVKTDESIEEVIVIFPFGLTKKMEYVEDKEIFMTRFLVPSNVKDGEYFCRLILKDNIGNIYKERKSFIVDNAPPTLKVEIKDEVSSGELVKIKVYADSDTKKLNAMFPYSKLVSLKYDSAEKASIGYLRVYDKMENGNYKLKVTATDFAHNCTTKEINIRVKSL